MLRIQAWQASDALARAQWTMFHGIGDEVGLNQDNRRRLLDLDKPSWTAWVDFLDGGPLPAEPSLPIMLNRLGRTAFSLSLLAERSAVAA